MRRYFNPRTPRGVRHRPGISFGTQRIFQSTHPARGATLGWIIVLRSFLHFNPRTPRGVRQVPQQRLGPVQQISIHAPREGCDSKLYQRAESLLGSICLFAQGEEG